MVSVAKLLSFKAIFVVQFELPEPVVQYAARTQESVILYDSSAREY